jgi:hypothetical protein
MRLMQSVMETSLALRLPHRRERNRSLTDAQGVSYRVSVGDAGSVHPNRAESDSFNRPEVSDIAPR